MGTGTALISLGEGEGAEPQLPVIKHRALQPGMAKILIAPEAMTLKTQTPRKRDASGGHLGNAPASTKDRWDNQNPKKKSHYRG